MKHQIFTILFAWIFIFNNPATSIKEDHFYLVDFQEEHTPNTLISNTTEKLKIVIENTGWKSEGITFDAVLPQKAELVSFSVSTHEQKYIAKKTNHQEAQQFLKQAKANNMNAAIYKPKYFDDMDFENVQTSSESVHIRPHHKITFDLEYNSDLLRGIVTEEKVIDEAFVIINLEGLNPSDLQAEIASPNYPNQYPNNGRFGWLLKTTEGYKINFTLSDLSIEKCCDQLLIYDGENSSSSVKAVLSGNKTAESSWSFQSKYNAFLIVFKSDCSVTQRGFYGLVNVVSGPSDNTTSGPVNPVTTSGPIATPRPVDPVTTPGKVDPISTSGPVDHVTNPSTVNPNASCNGGIYLQGSGYVHSTNFPGNYRSNQTCSWAVQSDNARQIYLDIAIYGLDDGDYLKIYDGDSIYTGDLIKSYTNVHRSSWYSGKHQSKSNALYIEFISDSQNTERGFIFYYNEVESEYGAPHYFNTASYPVSQHQAQCYGVQLLTDGYHFSPNYPNNYPGNSNCTWSIQTEVGKTIMLRVFVHGIADKDLLNVYDGQSSEAKLINSLTNIHAYGTRFTTGRYEYHRYYSTSNNMFITFTSNGDETEKGFFIYYDQRN